MSNRNLPQELAQLDDEIYRLELRRTSVVLLMELTAMLREESTNLIDFPVPSRIRVSRPSSEEWLSITAAPSRDPDDPK